MRAVVLLVVGLLAGCGDRQPSWDYVDPVGSSVTVSRETARADGLDAVLVTVLARDSEGNGLPGRAVSLVAGGGASAEPATGTTGATGALTALLSSPWPGGVTVQVAVDGVLLADQPSVTFTARLPEARPGER